MTTFKPPRQQRRPWFRRPRPAAVRKWADGVPLERPVEAWERLDRKLRELNFTACSGKSRLRCLQPLHRLARYLQKELEEELTGERFPPSQGTEARAAGARETWARLAAGYLCVQRDLGQRDAGARTEAALRGLQAMGQLMLICYHQYAPEPRGAWHAVHELREGAGKLSSEGGAPTRDGEAGDVEGAYKQILVMGAAGPYRLRPDEQAPVHRVLAEWVRHVAIRPLRGAEPKAPPVVFRPGEDEAPRQYALDHVPDAEGLRLIDPAPLAGRARRRLERIEAGDARPRLSGERLAGETLRVLLGAWSGAVSRQFPRSDAGQDTTMAIGLEQAWETLSGPGRTPHPCRLADRSSAGFQAILPDPPRGILQVGELVVVREGGEWTAGIVRWLRRAEPPQLQVGIETIARMPVPVRLSCGNGAGPGLLLQGNRAAHHPASLVTPPYPFREHMRVRVEDSGETLTLGRLVEGTGSVNRFRVENGKTPA